MAKIKTDENDFAIGSEWTNWLFNSEYGYYDGVTYTSSGLIKLYYQPKNDEDVFYAKARIAYKGRIYDLRVYNEVTRLGWVRMAKKWAKNIMKGV